MNSPLSVKSMFFFLVKCVKSHILVSELLMFVGLSLFFCEMCEIPHLVSELPIFVGEIHDFLDRIQAMASTTPRRWPKRRSASRCTGPLMRRSRQAMMINIFLYNTYIYILYILYIYIDDNDNDSDKI